MDRWGHRRRAEQLLDEGVEIVKKIGELADNREDVDVRLTAVLAQKNISLPISVVDGLSVGLFDAYTKNMDELGKKAMGIWAQAQVHATLAMIPEDDAREYSHPH